jgi:iron complex transport system substrate-binding protein
VGGGSGAAWTFTDDRGRTVSSSARPAKVLAYSRAALSLSDFGVACAGVFGSQHDADTGADAATGLSSVGAGADVSIDAVRELAPDLIVSVLYRDDTLYGIPPEVGAKFESLAPTVGLRVGAGRTLTEPLERFADLAVALGAPADLPATVQGRAALGEAARSVRLALEERAGLRVLALSAEAERVHLANPVAWPDLRYFLELGVGLLRLPVADDASWQTVLWDDVAEIPVDLILVDSRPVSLGQAQLAAHPVWEILPAVQAGQVGSWNPEAPLSFHVSARIVSDLAMQLGGTTRLT